MSFKKYITESAPVLHIDHLEDLIFLYGYKGAERTIKFIKDVFHDLDGKPSSGNVTQQKVDGGIAIYAGTNPENGKFFVATKSLFNKTPKINYTPEDIKNNHPSYLQKPLNLALKYFPEVIPEGRIYQGDYFFSPDDLESTTINGKKGIFFQPNTVGYFVEKGTPIYDKINNAKVGIVFHTIYTGNSLDSLKASFDIKDSDLKPSKNVYTRTPIIKQYDVTWTKEEKKELEENIKNIEKSLKNMDQKYIDQISNDKTLVSYIQMYMNQKVKENKNFQKNEIKHFIDFISQKYQEKIDKLKSDKGKTKKEEEKKELISNMRKNADTLYYMFKWVYNVQDTKNIIINKMNKLTFPESPYEKTPNGFQVMDPEGFVVSDGENNIKLVNRSVFSLKNFLNTKFK